MEGWLRGLAVACLAVGTASCGLVFRVPEWHTQPLSADAPKPSPGPNDTRPATSSTDTRQVTLSDVVGFALSHPGNPTIDVQEETTLGAVRQYFPGLTEVPKDLAWMTDDLEVFYVQASGINRPDPGYHYRVIVDKKSGRPIHEYYWK